MRKIAGLAIFVLVLSAHTLVMAAGWQVNFRLSHENGGSLSGEVWYNNDMIWRLKIQSDGALPVTSGSDPRVTVLTPDIVNGLFVLKVHR